MKTFYLFLVTLSLIITSTTNAYDLQHTDADYQEITWAINQYQDDWKEAEINNQIYIKPEAIILLDKNIYLLAGPVLIPMHCIHCDSNGYYFCHEGWFCWECCCCHYWNSKDLNTCQNCFRPRC